MAGVNRFYIPGWFSVLVSVYVTAVSLPAAAEKIFHCMDSKGKKVFTDNIRHCATSDKDTADSHITAVALTPQNLHSQYGQTVSEEYHNYAFRSYAPIQGYNINIIAEDKLATETPELLASAAGKLEQTVTAAIAYYPRHIHSEFNGIRYYLFTGAEARTGGRKGGFWYFRRGNSVSPRFDDSIVARSAKDYLKYSDTQAIRVAIHELGHAYYYYHRQSLYHANKQAFENAKKQNLYQDLAAQNGRTIKQAYAMTNEREYFAELVKIYLYDNWHAPTDRHELKTYDPVGFQMIQRALQRLP